MYMHVLQHIFFTSQEQMSSNKLIKIEMTVINIHCNNFRSAGTDIKLFVYS